MMRKIMVIDDDPFFLDFLSDYVHSSFPKLHLLSFSDPLKSLPEINPDLDLLLIDLEMPGLDGIKLLTYACAKGVSKGKIIILSAHEAEYLHRRIPMGECLAVLNKHEAQQKEVLDMVFAAVEESGTIH